MKQQDEQIIQQRLDFDLYTYFSAALNIHQSIQILYSSQHLELEKEIIMSLQVHIKFLCKAN